MDDKIGFDLIDKEFQKELEEERAKERAKLEEEIKAGKNPKFSQSQTDWMLAKFPYANNEQRDKAVSAEMEKRQREKERFEQEVEKRLGEKQAVLEQLHFGKHGRQFALEQSEREEKIQAFKQRQQEKREAEKKAKEQTTEQSKVKADVLVKEQKEKLAGEQNNAKQDTLNAGFNKSATKGIAVTDAQMKVEQFKKRRREEAGVSQDQTKAKDNDKPKTERTTPYLSDDFNMAHSKQELDDWHDGKPEAHSNVDSRLIYDSDVQASQSGGGQDGRKGDDLINDTSSSTTREEEFKEKMRKSFDKEGKDQSSDLEPDI